MVSKHYKHFMSHSVTVFMLHVGLSSFFFFWVLSVGLFCNLFSDSAVGCFIVELLYECSCFVFII